MVEAVVVGSTVTRSNNSVPLPIVKCLTNSPASQGDLIEVLTTIDNRCSNVSDPPARLPNLICVICWELEWTCPFSFGRCTYHCNNRWQKTRSS